MFEIKNYNLMNSEKVKLDEAVEYLTFKQVENDAKRRYEIEIKQQDLSFINRTAKRDIFKQDKNKQLD
ncbi:hypothetical protein NW066_03310 [Mycoplasmopsis felis]|uniref:hypothetical protein n=1 Tax=Mycoplasmopsis felis TaxID=33923 RepID=UPI0021B06D36|nr:hypothetical protein [Mycoplasmopsis felis]UWV84648.1 hypothetical protein NW066_03310 [Mycoplasmopsis felis]